MDTKAKKRVEIAKDVLAKLGNSKYRMQSGCYVEIDIENMALAGMGNSLQKLLKKVFRVRRECRVCALGALFLSYIDKYNRFKISDMFNCENFCTRDWGRKRSISTLNTNREPLADRLKDIFSLDQLKLIEVAFESPSGIPLGTTLGMSEETKDYLDRWHHSFDTSGERIIAICNNIVRNNGVFIPEVIDVGK